MRSKEIKKAIESLGPWKQRYEMEGQFTNNSNDYGQPVWKDLRYIFCEELNEMKILELESNSGYYSIMLSNEGAYVTAVEGNKKQYLQSQWTKYFFEQQHNKKYPVNFINKKPSELKFEKFGWFDYVLSDSSLDFFEGNKEKQKEYISKLCNITDKIIIRPEKNLIGYFNRLFLENEFYMLKRKTMDIPFLLYGRLVRKSIF
jgi:hypothetical protein